MPIRVWVYPHSCAHADTGVGLPSLVRHAQVNTDDQDPAAYPENGPIFGLPSASSDEASLNFLAGMSTV